MQCSFSSALASLCCVTHPPRAQPKNIQEDSCYARDRQSRNVMWLGNWANGHKGKRVARLQYAICNMQNAECRIRNTEYGIRHTAYGMHMPADITCNSCPICQLRQRHVKTICSFAACCCWHHSLIAVSFAARIAISFWLSPVRRCNKR